MKQLLYLVGFVLVGVVFAWAFQIQDLTNYEWYTALIGILLAIGLYSATFGIDLKEAKNHWKLIVAAITVGVVAKAAIIGGFLAWVLGDPFYFLLGIVVAQIDPLSVAALMDGKRMSPKAKTILASWSSFDDPITVILALYAPLILMQFFGGDWPAVTGLTEGDGVASYFKELLLNIAFAAGVFVVWLVLKKITKTALHLVVAFATTAIYLLLGSSLSIAAYYFWMLGAATIGLFLRPPIEKLIAKVTKIALAIATVLLGALLLQDINIGAGIALGATAYVTQIIVGFLMTFGLPMRDRIHLAFSQQNGITAIILALLLEPVYPGTVAIVAPAILVINLLHAGVNKVIDKFVLS